MTTIKGEYRITRDRLRSWGACYSDEKIAELVPSEGLAPLDVCDAAHVPVTDRLWVLLREDVLPAPTLRLLGVRWARAALEAARAAGREPDARSKAVCDVIERYVRGEATSVDLIAAAYAAADAAMDADRHADYAARDAADATWAASRDDRAAAYETWAAVLYSADAAAYAAWSAARAARDAGDAALYSTWAACATASKYADYAALRAAARDAQLADVRRVLMGGEP